jgi:hypothetical protein
MLVQRHDKLSRLDEETRKVVARDMGAYVRSDKIGRVGPVAKTPETELRWTSDGPPTYTGDDLGTCTG